MKQPDELVTIGRAAIELDLSEFGVRFAISQGDLRPVTVQRYGTLEQRLRIPESELDRWLRSRYVGDPREHRQANVDRARARVRALKREAHQAVLAAKLDVRRREAARRAEELAGARREANRLGSLSESRPRRQALPRGTTDDDLLLARKNALESTVRRAAGVRARRPDWHTLCSIPLADGTLVRWRYWPALGKREYLPFEGAAA
jgi:hypothetical protein